MKNDVVVSEELALGAKKYVNSLKQPGRVCDNSFIKSVQSGHYDFLTNSVTYSEVEKSEFMPKIFYAYKMAVKKRLHTPPPNTNYDETY